MWVSEGYLNACPLLVFHLSLGVVTDPYQGTWKKIFISESHGSTVAGKALAEFKSQNDGEKREVSDHLCNTW